MLFFAMLIGCNAPTRDELITDLAVKELQIEMVERHRVETIVVCYELATELARIEKAKAKYEVVAAKRNLDSYSSISKELFEEREEADRERLKSYSRELVHVRGQGDLVLRRWTELEWLLRTLQNEQRPICSDLRPHEVSCKYKPYSHETDLTAIAAIYTFPDCP